MTQITTPKEAVYDFTHIHDVTLHDGDGAALGISFHRDSLLFLYTPHLKGPASELVCRFPSQNHPNIGIQITSRSLAPGEGHIVPVFVDDKYQTNLSLTHPHAQGTGFCFPLSQSLSEPQFTFLQSEVGRYLNGLLGFMADSASLLPAGDVYLSIRFEKDSLLLPEDLSDASHSHSDSSISRTLDASLQYPSPGVLSLEHFRLLESHGRYNSPFSLDYRVARDGGLVLLTFFKNARVHPSWQTHVHHKIPENHDRKNLGRFLRDCLNL